MQRLRWVAGLALAWIIAGCATTPEPPAGPASPAQLNAIAQQVVIRRTEHGVPHILAENLRAAAFALAWVQLEDHGSGIIEGMNATRGRAALVDGPARAEADADARRRHARARAAFDSLRQDTRDVYEGFAAGMNHYIRTHNSELPAWVRPDFTAHDILVRDVVWPGAAAMNRFRRRLLEDTTNDRLLGAAANEPVRYVISGRDDEGGADGSEAVSDLGQDAANVGSNAWALAPSRTTSGHAILLRNPHLAWTAGYYEAHVRVPGKLDFYGDFRIGGPFTIIGGFNRDLGFATTNNASRNHEFYALLVDPTQPDHYLLDGVPVPLQRESVTVEARDDAGRTTTSTHEFWTTDLGPVVHLDSRRVYMLRTAASGDFRAGEQWLQMMQATSLEEWKQAMRTGARTSSSFTYADRAGNILYVWMSGAPVLPHPAGGDSLAILVRSVSDLWTRRMPFDSLPQLLNPPGGYLHNENDSPHYTNMNAIMAHSFRFPVEEPRLRLRSQHALELLHNERRFSLEDVVEAKHSMRMLLADRVKGDLLDGLRAAGAQGEIAEAAALLERWDNTAAAHARGAVLFEGWWDRYRQLMRGADLHEVEWSETAPTATPRGLADIDRAVEAFRWSVPATAERFGRWDVAWGDVHRVRRGSVDAPVGGCGGDLGCFRILNFSTDADGRRVVDGGDGWVIAIEFGDEPRAYSVLAYGQSPDPASPYHDSQAAMFAANRMKRVLWTEADIERGTVVRYRPGSRSH
ncbi:MAG: penicillin acylase family protein [Gemmatimonadetes bacterium]|nr:penicillin acylase family protein [Gemmatimonadota bacterium]